MQFYKIFLLLFAFIPSQVSAAELLSAGDLKFVFRSCFATFFQPAGQTYKIDRRRFVNMGFVIGKDDSANFEAKITISEGIYSFQKLKLGPEIDIDRNKRKPNVLRYKTCKISGGELKTGEPLITLLSSSTVSRMLKDEAKKFGFKPVKNRRSKVVWVKGKVVVSLDVAYRLYKGGPKDPPPALILVQGVHPKNLP
jgi:ribosomal protein S6E (S10)